MQYNTIQYNTTVITQYNVTTIPNSFIFLVGSMNGQYEWYKFYVFMFLFYFIYLFIYFNRIPNDS